VPADVGNKPEDVVNRRAAIHAICSLAQASVHHVLPIEEANTPARKKKAIGSYIHRVQSAMMDVMLAHSGYVIGASDFVTSQVSDGNSPKFICGVQALRRQAQRYSGESPVCMVIYSRINLSANVTEVNYAYKAGSKTSLSGWMPLSQGLIWLGCQRTMEGDEDWLKAEFTAQTTKVLQDIQAQDPRAVVFIDWETLMGLWRNLTDASLQTSAPAIGHLPLKTAFPLMSFVRLRYGRNAKLPIRSWSKTTYEGFREDTGRVPTGEYWDDGYAVTVKQLLEVPTTNTQQGHFIGVMGPRKTFQLLRGMSCYRFMSRMSKISSGAITGAGIFEKVRIPPSNKDASIPTSMDITILYAPADTPPLDVATLSMGLRVGYAHYDDWTLLPAPLFFARKIDDYIIKYPTAEIDSGSVDASSVDSEANIAVPAATVVDAELETDDGQIDSSELRLVSEQIQRELKLDFSEPEEEIPQGESASLETIAQSDPAKSDEPDDPPPEEQAELDVVLASIHENRMEILEMAKTYPPPRIFPAPDQKLRRFYCAMVRAEIKVVVEMPYFVDLVGYFGTYQPSMKKSIQRAWSEMQDFGYVPPGKGRWTNDRFLDEMAKNLLHPQGAYSVSQRAFGRLLIIPQINKIVEKHNRESEEKVVLTNRSGDNPLLDFSAIVKKACAEKDDETLAWMIFGAAQTPSFNVRESVLDYVTSVPGDMTYAALIYCVQCSVALRRALESFNKNGATKFESVYMKRLFAPTKAMSDETDVQQTDVEEAVTPTIQATNEPQLDKVMEIKYELKSIIDQIGPGDPTFAANLEKLQGLIQSLVDIDASEREALEKLASLATKNQDLIDLANHVLARIAHIDEESVIGKFEFCTPQSEDFSEAESSILATEAAVTRAETSSIKLGEVFSIPLPANSPKSEHIRRAQQISSLGSTLHDEFEQIKRLLNDSPFFAPQEGGPGTPDGEGHDLPQKTGAKDSDRDIPSQAPAQEPAVALEAAPEPAAHAQAVAMESVSGRTAAPAATAPVVSTSAPAAQLVAPAVAPVVAEKAPAPTALSAALQLPATAIAAPSDEKKSPQATVPAETRSTLASEQTSLTPDEKKLEQAYVRLKTIMELRHYGLASVYIEAIKTSFGETNVHVQGDILSALADTLESIDCHFVVDPRLHPSLRRLFGRQASFGNVADSLGILAAGFVSALFSSTSLSGESESDALWAVFGPVRPALERLPSVAALIDLVATRLTKGITLSREKLSMSQIGSKLAMQAEVERSCLRAQNWVKDPQLHSSWYHVGFGRAHEYLFSNKHVIGQCIGYIAKNDVKSVRKAYEEAQGKFRKPAVTFAEAFKAVGEKSKPDGRYGVNACENIEITDKFIREYLAATDQDSGRKDMPPHELEFLKKLHESLTEALADLKEFHPVLCHEKIYVQSAITVFDAVLRLFKEAGGAACLPVSQQKLLLQVPMDRNFNPSMADSEEFGIKAVCSAEYVLQEIDDTLAEDLSGIASPISDAVIDHLLKDALQVHVQAKRFIPAFAIESQFQRGDIKLDPPLQQQYQKTRAELSQELQYARQRVTHAMALSALDQKDASKLLNIIENIHAQNSMDRGIGHPDGASTAYPDFPHALATLQNQVVNVLDSKLGEAKDKLLATLAAYEESHGDESRKDVQRIRQMLSTNNPASIRTAHDALTILRNSGKLPAYVSATGRNAAKDFDYFLTEMHKIRGQQVLLDSLEHVLTNPLKGDVPGCISELSDPQRTEAARFVAGWKEMCSMHGIDAAEKAGDFFAALGIGRPVSMPDRTSRNTPAKFEFPPKAFGSISSSDCFLPPSLGSNAAMIVGHVVSGVHPESEISTLIQDVSSVPTFILSRAGFNLQRRAKLSGHQPVLLIDDNLIAYMALHPEDRVRRMMEIATLTFHTIPYSAEGTYVPREMFFGRQRELISLRGVKSLAILYGGRRLGKSSLLAQIEREESNVPGSMAIYIPMDRDFAGENHVLFAWRKLYSGLASRGLIDVMPTNETNWEKIRDWVEQQLCAKTQKYNSCYLLFDEADNLMAHELDLPSGQGGFIRSLQRTSEHVGPNFRLRYVIAGLHNLARMTQESNSALGKAETIALEPFSTDDDILRGVELVTKPMAALGFYFPPGSEDLPLRILSICNFYPAFIQIYCRKLLEHMYNKRTTQNAWANITVSDLESVERDHDLLSELQQKFGWTLDLDKRYKAIGLILADFYYSEAEQGKNEGLTVGDIRMWCEMEVPTHFKGMNAGAYEGLVDEMRKLNVLEKNGSRYRLRNPSIAMLIGDRARIAYQLKALADSTPEKARNHGDRRNALSASSGNHHQVSEPIFPMPVAWTHANMEVIDGRLVVLAGNILSGLSDITSSRTEWQLNQNSTFAALALPAASLNTHIAHLRKVNASKPKGMKTLLVSTTLAWKASEIPLFVAGAVKAANLNTRLALAAMPDRMLEISDLLEKGALIPPNDRKLDWGVEPIPAWSLDAVRFYLGDNFAVAENPVACQAIIDASCGFGREIQHICPTNLTEATALGLYEKAKTVFAPSLSVFYEKIGMPKSIPEEKLKRMQDFMAMIDSAPRNSPEVDDALINMCGLSEATLQFLRWMGLMQEGDGNTWMIPKLYRRLLD